MIRLLVDTIALAKGGHMKKLALLLVVAAFAASPAVAATKEKKTKQTTEAEEIAKQHDNTRRALRDALPLVLPSWSLPVYFGMHLDETKNETKNEKKKK
jgi:hypothetical protein